MSNIKNIRERLRMTQAALAVAVGVTQSAIAHYENERRKPGLEECRKIVAAFNSHGAGVTLDEVFPPADALSAA
ncbi:helix-turn-helix transcriptional regulator [Pseudomonas sp. UBA6562]|uniref:helix-turn-helix transcriptional regulator n=1 Tax=Pseudomonas sp. UBA6562 TaxID=1947332 RepID=UPI0025D93F4D|nr:helix-turn-helix transcriptional regulator [Pseudomonas sp. UBA6562]